MPARPVPPARPRAELAAALWRNWPLILSTVVFSAFVNLLMLTGPLFMLQVYDRVLASRSVETLTALTVLMIGLFALMGLLDAARGQVMSRIGARVYARLARRVDDAALRHASADADSAVAPRDLATVQQALSSQAPFVFFDMPWTPVFVAALFLFHFWLGAFAVLAGVLMLAVTLANRYRSRRALDAARRHGLASELMSDSMMREAETMNALGMRGAALDRLAEARGDALQSQIEATDRTGAFSAVSRSLRFFLQSAMLAVGALLAIRQEITPGAMIAASILLGRALAPIDQAITHWSTIQRGAAAWARLRDYLRAAPPEARPLELPAPAPRLSVADLRLRPPGAPAPTLSGVSFELAPGEALGVIGHSASGKSCLARALVGAWTPEAGEIRLDGATLDQWRSDALGRLLGYLPQTVDLFPGSVAENIARLDPNARDEDVVAAARRADAHEMILGLPMGYETRVGPGGGYLSGGQRQRVGLARAVYGDPALLVLDEPNAHLDAPGEASLNSAIMDWKRRGRIAVVMAHRPNAIAVCDRLLILDRGRMRAYGRRDEILRNHARTNTRLVARAPAMGETDVREAAEG